MSQWQDAIVLLRAFICYCAAWIPARGPARHRPHLSSAMTARRLQRQPQRRMTWRHSCAIPYARRHAVKAAARPHPPPARPDADADAKEKTAQAAEAARLGSGEAQAQARAAKGGARSGARKRRGTGARGQAAAAGCVAMQRIGLPLHLTPVPCADPEERARRVAAKAARKAAWLRECREGLRMIIDCEFSAQLTAKERNSLKQQIMCAMRRCGALRSSRVGATGTATLQTNAWTARSGMRRHCSVAARSGLTQWHPAAECACMAWMTRCWLRCAASRASTTGMSRSALDPTLQRSRPPTWSTSRPTRRTRFMRWTQARCQRSPRAAARTCR